MSRKLHISVLAAASAPFLALLPPTAMVLADEPLPDPTRPALSAAPATATTIEQGEMDAALSLQSTFTSPHRRLAIINGTMVEIGDTVGEARVVKILPGRVILLRDEKEEILESRQRLWTPLSSGA